MHESPKAKRAWSDYLALGADRSLAKLLASYRGSAAPPTTRCASLKEWSVTFGWQKRLQALADEEASRVVTEQAEWRARVRANGLAILERRVEDLNARWELLRRLIEERAADPLMQHVPGGATGLLAREIKIGRDGKPSLVYAVDIATLAELRAIEKQAAEELGQWRERRELSGKDGGGVEIKWIVEVRDEERAQRIESVLDHARARRDGQVIDAVPPTRATNGAASETNPRDR